MKAVSKTQIKGNNGLSIQLDRGRIKYSENGKNLNIQIEHGVGEISIFGDSIKNWFPPNSMDVIDDLQKQRIINNVCEAMRLIGVKATIE